ncbi:hypothetical protein ACOSQ3_004860 [Xanthoceras sorbifolium]
MMQICCLSILNQRKKKIQRDYSYFGDVVVFACSCSCNNFESKGIPCGHILSNLSKMKSNICQINTS